MMVLNCSDLDPKPAKLVYFLFCTLYKAQISYNTIKQYQHSEISPLTKPGLIKRQLYYKVGNKPEDDNWKQMAFVNV